MIVDAHAHIYEFIGGPGVFSSAEEHLGIIQARMAAHPMAARRVRDNTPVAEPTLWDGRTPGRAGLLDVNFRASSFGRFEWEKDGESYYLQLFPPYMVDMSAGPELFLAQMQHVGVDKSLLQFNRLFGSTNEYLSMAVRRWPDKFRACTEVLESRLDDSEQIMALRNAVRALGLTALYFSGRDFSPDGLTGDLDDERYMPFWDEVEALGIPIAWDIRPAPRHAGHSAYMAQAAHLHKHISKYPRVQNVLTHCFPPNALTGEGTIDEALLAMLREPNMTAELLLPLLSYERIEYPYAEKLPIVHQLYQSLGATKLTWGSDMPAMESRCTYRQSLEYLTRHCDFISEGDMDLITGENANRIYFSVTPSFAER